MLVWGQSGISLKEQSCPELDISLKGIKGPSKGPMYIGIERARTYEHILFYSILREEDGGCWRQGSGGECLVITARTFGQIASG